MKRRAFVAWLAAEMFIPKVTGAQQPKAVQRIGLLVPTTWDPNHPQVVAFRERMRELGWVEGLSIALEPRGGSVDQLPGLAAELVALNPNLVVSWSPAGTAALKQRTAVIPIVMAAGGDPVEQGLVTSLSRPGGNITGVSAHSMDLYGKRVELLREAVPGVSSMGVLWDASDPLGPHIRRVLENAGKTIRVTLEFVEAATGADLDKAFDILLSKRAGAVLVTAQARNYSRAREIAAIALRRKIPTLFGEPVSVHSGGLMAHTIDWVDLSRKAATYVDRILRGEKPGNLPIDFPTKFEFLVNMRTAKSIGLTIPPSLLLRADQVIE